MGYYLNKQVNVESDPEVFEQRGYALQTYFGMIVLFIFSLLCQLLGFQMLRIWL